MSRFVFVRFVLPAALLAACSATAPLPEQPATGGTGGASGAGRAGSAGTSTKAGGTGGASAVGGSGVGAAGEGNGGADAGGGSTAGKAGAAGKAQPGGAAGKAQAGGGQSSAGEGGTSGTAGLGGANAGTGGSGDPFGGGGSENGGAGGAEVCDLVKVPAGDGLSCSSINYITTGDACLGCERGPSLYFCEGPSAPPSPGCTTLPDYGAGYFCCEKSVCTPQPGGCDADVRYHCPPDATVPSACKKLGGDPTSYCCPK